MGLPTPDPIPKIAEVARGPSGKPYRMAAVGRPMEWDQTVPYFGRREIVKGAVYSFYEFGSDSLFNDKEWQDRLSKENRLGWIETFVSDRALACPPRQPF
jgi:hypothetical protein